ncbi:MAG: SDR family oxidoreductase [Mycobacterium sp.]
MGSVYSKVVFITGGARGIGADLARSLVAKGAYLVLTDIDAEPLAAIAAELGGESRVLTAIADVRDLPAMQAAADRAVEQFGGIDIVVANAGIASLGSVAEVDPESFQRVMDVNVVGVFKTVRATLAAVTKRRGYVLIVSSFAAFAACPGLSAYQASKAGVEHFANTLRLEVAHHGVDVGCAHMSWIDTDLVQEAKADLPAFLEFIAAMPGPIKKTTSVDECVTAFVTGIEGRKKRIYCPDWVRLFRWIRPLLAMPIGELDVRRVTPRLLPQMDGEAKALGRSISARTNALETR